MNSLENEWIGYYEYGFGYNLDFFGKRVKISINLIDQNGNISGICNEEDSEISVNQNSEIRGFYEDNLISFIKTYPDNNSEEDWEIEYFGEINETKQKIYGKWIISESYIDDSTKLSKNNSGEGIWYLEKK